MTCHSPMQQHAENKLQAKAQHSSTQRMLKPTTKSLLNNGSDTLAARCAAPGQALPPFLSPSLFLSSQPAERGRLLPLPSSLATRQVEEVGLQPVGIVHQALDPLLKQVTSSQAQRVAEALLCSSQRATAASNSDRQQSAVVSGK